MQHASFCLSVFQFYFETLGFFIEISWLQTAFRLIFPTFMFIFGSQDSFEFSFPAFDEVCGIDIPKTIVLDW